MKGRRPFRSRLRPALLALRDGLIPLLPRPFRKKLAADFAFLVHPRDLRDVERRYPAFRRLPPKLQDWILRDHPPVVLGQVTVHDRLGRRAQGYLISISLTAEQMLLKPPLARKKIRGAVRLAEALGCRVVGLGALTASLTHAGTWLLDRLPSSSAHSLALTTGNAYTVAIAA